MPRHLSLEKRKLPKSMQRRRLQEEEEEESTASSHGGQEALAVLLGSLCETRRGQATTGSLPSPEVEKSTAPPAPTSITAPTPIGDTSSQARPQVEARTGSCGSSNDTRASTWASLKVRPLDIKGGTLALRASELAREITRRETPVLVKLVSGTDIVHVTIKGDTALFDSIGIFGIDTSLGPKRVEYLSVPANKYRPHLAGGEGERYTITAMSEEDVKNVLSVNRSLKSKIFGRPPSGPVAYINGGFYGNSGIRQDEIGIKTYEKNAPIGDAKVKGIKQIEGVRPQDQYMDDFHQLPFSNGSFVTLAPKLAAVNKVTGKYEAQFTVDKASNSMYLFENTPLNRPGELGHSSHPNGRSAIDMPVALAKTPASTSHKTNNIRLAIGCDDSGVRGATSTGMTMVEWSNVMTRLGALNQSPGVALNCDGGSSSVLGVIDEKGKVLFQKRGIESSRQLPTAANFIAVARNKQ